MKDQVKAPTSFWVISVIGLIWNLMGCSQWFVEYNYWKNPISREALPEQIRGMYEFVPGWIYVVFGIAVIAGVIGCVGLLMRRSWASLFLVISLIAIAVQHLYNAFGTDLIEEMGASIMVMPVITLIIGAFLVYFARRSRSAGILI